jgi:hypothetical protein
LPVAPIPPDPSGGASDFPPASAGGTGGVSESRRIAVACTRAVGNSVVRHHHIRKLREYYRLNKDKFPVNHILLLHVRARIIDWNIFEIKIAELLKTIK